MNLKRLGVLVSGWTLIVIGIAGLVLPLLPGLPLLLLGLAVLSGEHSWAHWALAKLQKRIGSYRRVCFYAARGHSCGRGLA